MKKELQKEIDKCIKSTAFTFRCMSLENFYDNIKDIVARMPDDESEIKPRVKITDDQLQKIKNIFGIPHLSDAVRGTFESIVNRGDFYEFYKPETKPEPSLLEVAMNIYCGLQESTLKGSFDTAELIIAENERRKK